MRYKLRANNNFHDVDKIWFGRPALWNPASPAYPPYHIETNLYTYWVQYPDSACLGWPPQGTYHLGESGLWVSVPDYPQNSLGSAPRPSNVGIRPSNLAMFPRQNSGVDDNEIPNGGADGRPLTKIETISQANLTGKTISLELAQGGSFTSPLTGWGWRFLQDAGGTVSCVSDLPSGPVYRKWIVTADIDGTAYSWEYAVPEAKGRYLDFPPWNNLFSTEFQELPGLFQVYLWDVAIQRENSAVWEPITKWIMGYRSDPAPNLTYGSRLADYGGVPVIEFSNDGTDTYFQLGEQFTVPPTVAGLPQGLPTIRWAVSEQMVSEAVGTVNVVATLDRPAPSQVSVPVVVGGTATYPQDHGLTGNQVVTIPMGATSGTFSFNVVDDNIPEAPETVTLRLDGPLVTPNPVKLGSVLQHTVTLTTPTAIVTSANDTLTITGTQANDCIAVWLTGNLSYPLAVTNVCVAGLLAGPGCVQFGSQAALCVGASTGTVELRGGDDSFQDGHAACPDGASTSIAWTRVSGDAGQDTICSGLGSIVALGGPGNDTIRANGGITILALYWQNWLQGEDGNDAIFGGPASDLIDGGPGKDELRANGGADAIFARDGVKDDEVHCGDGADVAEIDPNDPTHQCETFLN